jgi:hypothetical protein
MREAGQEEEESSQATLAFRVNLCHDACLSELVVLALRPLVNLTEIVRLIVLRGLALTRGSASRGDELELAAPHRIVDLT